MCNSEQESTTPAATPAKVDVPDYNERLAYGTDQGRWLMEQVQSTPDGAAKRRAATRPQRAFHDEDSLSTDSSTPAAVPSDALSVKQGGLCAGSERPVWQQPRVLLAAAAVVGFLFLVLVVSR